MPLACFDANVQSAHLKHAKGMSLRYGVIISGNLMDFLQRKYFIIRGFCRETASGFYPWGKVDSPRKRVAE